MAPKPAQAITVACASPPRTVADEGVGGAEQLVRQPGRATKLPIRMNSGTTLSV
jgi:hypothetical protein